MTAAGAEGRRHVAKQKSPPPNSGDLHAVPRRTVTSHHHRYTISVTGNRKARHWRTCLLKCQLAPTTDNRNYRDTAGLMRQGDESGGERGNRTPSVSRRTHRLSAVGVPSTLHSPIPDGVSARSRYYGSSHPELKNPMALIPLRRNTPQ